MLYSQNITIAEKSVADGFESMLDFDIEVDALSGAVIDPAKTPAVLVNVLARNDIAKRQKTT